MLSRYPGPLIVQDVPHDPVAHIPAAAAISHLRPGLVRVLLKPGTGLPARKWAHVTRTPPGA